MPVAAAFREGRAVAGAQHSLAAILDQGEGAFEHIDELILVAMPVALAGPAARRQTHQVDAEVLEPARIPQPLARARGTRLIERRRIARAGPDLDAGDIDFRHAHYS